MDNESFTYDEAKTLTPNTFSRTGYTFDGWATTADGDVAYTDGQSVSNLTAENGATVELFAHWSSNTATSGIDWNPSTNSGTFMENGTTPAEGTYDLSGRRIQGQPTQKGVYIQNGKKVVIK